MLFIKPANENLIIRMHDKPHEVLPAHGAPVKPSVYWTRRMRDGDVKEITEKEFKNGETKARKQAEKERKAAEAKAQKAAAKLPATKAETE